MKVKDLMKAHGVEIRNKGSEKWSEYVDDKIGNNYYMTAKLEQSFVKRLLSGETLVLNFWGLAGAEDEIRLKPIKEQ